MGNLLQARRSGPSADSRRSSQTRRRRGGRSGRIRCAPSSPAGALAPSTAVPATSACAASTTTASGSITVWAKGTTGESGPGAHGGWGCMGLSVRAGTLRLHRGRGGAGACLEKLGAGAHSPMCCSEVDALDVCPLGQLRVGLRSSSSWTRERWGPDGAVPVFTFALSLWLYEELGLLEKPGSPSPPWVLLRSGLLSSLSTQVLTVAHGWAQALSTQCGICLTGCPAPCAGGHLCLRGVLCQPHAAAHQPPL